MKSSEYILKTSKEYSLYVARNRAIPSICDGLKHGQRMSLWILRNRDEKIKTYALSGLLAYSRLYVHGDTSLNDTIGKLAAPYINNHPLIEGLGQFGNRLAPIDGIGAPRYTEVRRSKIADLLLYNDLDLIPLEDNYDGSNKQPKHFLPLIPLTLLNGISGIAVGWATDIYPHSLKSIIDGCLAALNGKTIKQIEPHFERYNVSVKNVGTNQWEIYGKAEVIDTSTARITELPPGISIEAFRKKLISMEDDNSIVSFTDRSSDSIDITVKFLRGSIAGWNESKIIDFFKIREKITERFVVLDWSGEGIRVYPDAETIIAEYVQWRLNWYTKRFEKLKYDAEKDLSYWSILERLFSKKFPSKLGTFENRKAIEEEIIKLSGNLDINDHLDKIVSLPTYRWSKDFEKEIITKISDLKAKIEEYVNILASPEKLKQVYISELEEIKKAKI